MQASAGLWRLQTSSAGLWRRVVNAFISNVAKAGVHLQACGGALLSYSFRTPLSGVLRLFIEYLYSIAPVGDGLAPPEINARPTVAPANITNRQIRRGRRLRRPVKTRITVAATRSVCKADAEGKTSESKKQTYPKTNPPNL